MKGSVCAGGGTYEDQAAFLRQRAEVSVKICRAHQINDDVDTASYGPFARGRGKSLCVLINNDGVVQPVFSCAFKFLKSTRGSENACARCSCELYCGSANSGAGRMHQHRFAYLKLRARE